MTAMTMHLRCPSQLIAIVPFILGFRPTDSLVAIALTDGRVGLTSRVDLPPPDHPERAVQALLPVLHLDPSEEAPQIMAQDAAWAAQTLRDVTLRDGIIAWLTPGTLDTAELGEAIQAVLTELGPSPQTSGADAAEVGLRLQSRLIALCTMLPNTHACRALTVLAAQSWWHGNGALPRVALDRALRCDPDYRLAQLLLLMVDQGISPVAR